MIAEFEWNHEKTFLGILIHQESLEQIQTYNLVDKSKKFPLLCMQFGSNAFVEHLTNDQEWLEFLLLEHIKDKKLATIFYFSTLEFENSSYEIVLLSCDEKNHKLLIESKDGLLNIVFNSINQNKLYSYGFEIFNQIINQNIAFDFHIWIEKCILENPICHRNVNKRKIYYLDQLTMLSLKNIVHKLHFGKKIKSVMKNYLKCEKLEVWNAFAVVIPPHLNLKDQVIHRDCLYNSVSIFFYLNQSNEPTTQFFPFTHRTLQTFIPPIKQYLEPFDLLIMDSKLLHGGMGGINPTNSNRILYVFQYRDSQESRHVRAINISNFKNAISKTSQKFPTVFNPK